MFESHSKDELTGKAAAIFDHCWRQWDKAALDERMASIVSKYHQLMIETSKVPFQEDFY